MNDPHDIESDPLVELAREVLAALPNTPAQVVAWAKPHAGDASRTVVEVGPNLPDYGSGWYPLYRHPAAPVVDRLGAARNKIAAEVGPALTYTEAQMAYLANEAQADIARLTAQLAARSAPSDPLRVTVSPACALVRVEVARDDSLSWVRIPPSDHSVHKTVVCLTFLNHEHAERVARALTDSGA